MILNISVLCSLGFHILHHLEKPRVGTAGIHLVFRYWFATSPIFEAFQVLASANMKASVRYGLTRGMLSVANNRQVAFVVLSRSELFQLLKNQLD